MAAALFRHALSAQPEPLRSLEVRSAGVSALSGYPASSNAVYAMQKVGIALDTHRSQRLTQDMLDRALAVFCMTESHRALIEMQFQPAKAPVHLLREFLRDGDGDIPDPFGMGVSAYEASRDSMVEAVPSLLGYLRSLIESERASPAS
jgi:protein-tyrosine-phosphatase